MKTNWFAAIITCDSCFCCSLSFSQYILHDLLQELEGIMTRICMSCSTGAPRKSYILNWILNCSMTCIFFIRSSSIFLFIGAITSVIYPLTHLLKTYEHNFVAFIHVKIFSGLKKPFFDGFKKTVLTLQNVVFKICHPLTDIKMVIDKSF